MNKDLLENLKYTEYQLKQYRLLTNKLINRNVSQYNISKFIEEEYIEDIYKRIKDYDYDLYNWLSPDLLKEVSDELIRLEQQLKKKDKVIEKAIEYIKETSIGSILEVHCGCEEDYIEPLLEILEDKGE